MSQDIRKRKVFSESMTDEEDEDDPHVDHFFFLILLGICSKNKIPRLLQIDSNTFDNFFEASDDLAWTKYIRFDTVVFSDILTRITPLYEKTSLRPNETGISCARHRVLS